MNLNRIFRYFTPAVTACFVVLFVLFLAVIQGLLVQEWWLATSQVTALQTRLCQAELRLLECKTQLRAGKLVGNSPCEILEALAPSRYRLVRR